MIKKVVGLRQALKRRKRETRGRLAATARRGVWQNVKRIHRLREPLSNSPPYRVGWHVRFPTPNVRRPHTIRWEKTTAVAVKIKLKRMGKIREPYYRIVVADARTKRDGRAIEEIGKYHPKADPSFIEVNSDRAQHWLSVGAQPTEPVRKLLEITGDWQRFKGLPGAEGTLKVATPRSDKREIFAAALAETLAESASASKTKTRAGSAKAGETKSAGAKGEAKAGRAEAGKVGGAKAGKAKASKDAQAEAKDSDADVSAEDSAQGAAGRDTGTVQAEDTAAAAPGAESASGA